MNEYNLDCLKRAVELKEKLTINNTYCWRHDRERILTYLGKEGSWSQFALLTKPNNVWCEVLAEDLHLIEEALSEAQP